MRDTPHVDLSHDGDAASNLTALAKTYYDQLHLIAHRMGKHERFISRPTMLALEVFLGNFEALKGRLDNPPTYGEICEQVRRKLIDIARHRLAQSRGAGSVPSPLDENSEVPRSVRDADMEALNEALAALRRHDPELWEIVELRFFGRLTGREISEKLDLPISRVFSLIQKALNFLRSFLDGRASK